MRFFKLLAISFYYGNFIRNRNLTQYSRICVGADIIRPQIRNEIQIV